MANGPYIAEAASLIGDPARANMLSALLGGMAMSATELGLEAKVAPSTASGHLAKLLDGNLISVVQSGRHRYFQLASPEVAQMLEALMALASAGPRRHRPKGRCDEAMARARTCYDHVAGKLGVALADSLVSNEHVVLSAEGGLVTEAGKDFLSRLGIDLGERNGGRRALCRACLDWSERRWHIGGAIGAAMAARFFDLEWIERQRPGRVVAITSKGENGFRDWFEIRV